MNFFTKVQQLILKPGYCLVVRLFAGIQNKAQSIEYYHMPAQKQLFYYSIIDILIKVKLIRTQDITVFIDKHIKSVALIGFLMLSSYTV